METKTLKKEVYLPEFTNKKYILLGIRAEDNNKVWLEQAKWECDWYYGYGYLEVEDLSRTDINEHFHFDMFFKGKYDAHTEIKQYFKKTVLSDSDLFKLCDYMNVFYELSHAYSIYHCGGGHYTNTNIDLKNTDMQDKIKQDMKKVIKESMLLLAGEPIEIL